MTNSRHLNTMRSWLEVELSEVNMKNSSRRPDPVKLINQRHYHGQQLGVKVDEHNVYPIPEDMVHMVVVDDRILDVAPISRLPIVILSFRPVA